MVLSCILLAWYGHCLTRLLYFSRKIQWWLRIEDYYKLELPEIDLSEPLFNLINYVGKSIQDNDNSIFKNNFNIDVTKVLEKIYNDKIS